MTRTASFFLLFVLLAIPVAAQDSCEDSRELLNYYLAIALEMEWPALHVFVSYSVFALSIEVFHMFSLATSHLG